jgi:hypothetical protein
MSYVLDKALLLTRRRHTKCVARAFPPSKVEIEAQAYLERSAALWDAFTEAHPTVAAAFVKQLKDETCSN